jgi:hypothetical protein
MSLSGSLSGRVGALGAATLDSNRTVDPAVSPHAVPANKGSAGRGGIIACMAKLPPEVRWLLLASKVVS